MWVKCHLIIWGYVCKIKKVLEAVYRVKHYLISSGRVCIIRKQPPCSGWL
jgi:hypothetical protein